jgi:RimJ/RimL family protein N-acetyltransferase
VTAGPLLRSDRLELWRPRATDLADLVELVAVEETRRFLGPSPPTTKAQFDRLLRHAGSWSLYGYGMLFARLPGEPAIIGSCGVFHSWRGFGQGMDDVPEAGWIIHRRHWGKGYAVEAMRVALAWFDAAHRASRITAMIDEGNLASQKVARRLGFVEYGEQDQEDTRLILYERLIGSRA